ncbi:SdpI family protein [Sphaerospermopsis aphanizomenoides]|uniref:SdpI family protein n=1 Tax=Sphaerospermopsis aphanizomenoides TaxID=459663 RepID=UPI002D80E05F|nr:SdpI family protein [Sphaerospermopsis aphanizomenoides]
MPPNCGYGIRTPKTLSAPRIWYLANKFAGRVLMFASGFYLTVVVLTIHLPSINQNFGVWLLHFGSFMIPLLVSLLLIQRYIKNL